MRIPNLATFVVAVAATAFLAGTAAAGPVTVFNTGTTDGRIATASRTAGGGNIEIETADDFILGQPVLVTGATFTGLMVGTSPSITDVEIELYHIFPVDSGPFSGNVPTRNNSPSDTNFGSSFDFGNCTVNCSTTVLNPSFMAANSVLNGINKSLTPATGGEGAVSGQEVLFTITFATPFLVGAADHDFFRPEVGLSGGTFYWLSAPKPITSGTPFSPDLQAWIRDANLNPDWLRIGTDIVGGGATAPTYNMTFTLAGTPLPEPSTIVLLGAGLAALAWWRRRSL